MKVRVYAPTFCSFKHVDEDGYMTLPDGATLSDVYKKLGIPLVFRRLVFSSVNYKREEMNAKLKDGDVISFLLPFSGG